MRTVAVFPHDTGVGYSYAALVVVADKLCGLNGTVGIVSSQYYKTVMHRNIKTATAAAKCAII